jgi:hypothetical protein
VSLPLYTLLRKIPSRGLPAEFVMMENLAEHMTRRDAFEVELMSSSLLPKPAAPISSAPRKPGVAPRVALG